MYTVWSDSDSHVQFHREYESLENACSVASRFVHEYDGKPYRVIVHVDDEDGETVDTYENINPCDCFYESLYEVRAEDADVS